MFTHLFHSHTSPWSKFCEHSYALCRNIYVYPVGSQLHSECQPGAIYKTAGKGKENTQVEVTETEDLLVDRSTIESALKQHAEGCQRRLMWKMTYILEQKPESPEEGRGGSLGAVPSPRLVSCSCLDFRPVDALRGCLWRSQKEESAGHLFLLSLVGTLPKWVFHRGLCGALSTHNIIQISVRL